MPSNRELILVSNPGSQSRKYAVYSGQTCLAQIHFEIIHKEVHYRLTMADQTEVTDKAHLSHITFAATKICDILISHNVITSSDEIATIGLRIVAPSSYFQSHRVIDKQAVKLLQNIKPKAVIHINSVLQEIELLSINFPNKKNIRSV